MDYTGTAAMDPSWPEASQHHHRNQAKMNDNDYYDDDDDEEEDIWDRMESRVPFGAVILIIVGYIFLGALMFNKFEGWTLIQSVYFCYITLATIGFGDYVCSRISFFFFLSVIFNSGSRYNIKFNIRFTICSCFALHSFRFSHISHVF